MRLGMMKLERKPLYKKIYDDLIDKIITGTYQSNQKLPSEKELDALYQASRTPVRQALNLLENEGYIYRLQGKGSFVANRGSQKMWATMSGFRTTYMEEGKKISSQTIAVKTVKHEQYAKLLEVPEEQELIHLKRVRYFDQRPILYLEHYLHPKLPYALFTDQNDFLTINEVLKQTKFTIVEADEEIESILAPVDVASFLHIPPQTPVLKVTRVSFDQEGLPIDINLYFVHTKNWKYRIRFTQQTHESP